MPYHLFIQVNDEGVKQHYEKAVKTFNNKRGDTHRDSGFDLFVTERIDSNSFSGVGALTVNHKVACAVYERVLDDILTPAGFYMFPRSSISKTPYRLANSVGIIDSGYRGHLMGKIDKVYDVEHVVNVGDRMFQICAPDLSPFERVVLVDSLDETERGTGGFGSTGK